VSESIPLFPLLRRRTGPVMQVSRLQRYIDNLCMNGYIGYAGEVGEGNSLDGQMFCLLCCLRASKDFESVIS
jgi:hypothetical protein